MDGKQDVRRRFSDLHAQALNVFGQARQRILNAVLGEHLRDVQVGSDPKRHGNGELAVAGRLAAQVKHVLNAVDLLLERRCHRPRHGVGGRARIDCCDLYGGRHDLRILRDRQDRQRAKTNQRHEDAEDRRQDGPVNEDVGQAHVETPVLTLAVRARVVLNRAFLRVDLAAWHCVHQPLDDHTVLRAKT
jgi:hypothetical protein